MDKFTVLKELGAGDFQHLNGSLEAHLKGTEKLLKSWGSSQLLQTAGLFHAAYGTAGFSDSMVSLEKRSDIASIIGKAAEALVYLYCSCDRDFVLPQFGQKETILFKDRFNGREFYLTKEETYLFCELTVANEMELILESFEFKDKYGSELLDLFNRMQRFLSKSACSSFKTALGQID